MGNFPLSCMTRPTNAHIQVSQEEKSIFWEVTVSVILTKNCICTCPILNGFRDRAISLYRSLDLAPSIVLLSCCTASLSEACKLV